MATFIGAFPVLPGKDDDARKFAQETMGRGEAFNPAEAPWCRAAALAVRERAPATQAPASPMKTRMARPRLTISSSARRPILSPSLERGTVVILSTISLLGSRSPFRALGST